MLARHSCSACKEGMVERLAIWDFSCVTVHAKVKHVEPSEYTLWVNQSFFFNFLHFFSLKDKTIWNSTQFEVKFLNFLSISYEFLKKEPKDFLIGE
jgi:hypothetical protein